jgi:hypothetical protein
MGNLEYRIQLKDTGPGAFGTSLIGTGGQVFVAAAGTAHKIALVDKNGASIANPQALTRGFMNFFVPDTTASVDLYIQAPGGQFKVVTGVTASGPNEIPIDTPRGQQLFKIPFSIADSVANVEQTTGFVLPVNSMVLDRLHGAGLEVTVAETAGAKTITVGTLSTLAGGSATGLINGSSTGTLGQVIGTNGGLFSSNAPALVGANPAANVISYTLVTASVAAEGFILLPVLLG